MKYALPIGPKETWSTAPLTTGLISGVSMIRTRAITGTDAAFDLR